VVPIKNLESEVVSQEAADKGVTASMPKTAGKEKTLSCDAPQRFRVTTAEGPAHPSVVETPAGDVYAVKMTLPPSIEVDSPPEVSVLSGNVTPGMTYERIKVVGKVGVNSDMDTGTMRPEFNGFCPPTRESTKRFPDNMTFQAVVVDVLVGEGEFVDVMEKV
jgi:hypothetical protein